MRFGTARTAIFRKPAGFRLLAAVTLLVASRLACAQIAQPSVCNLDSTGFCVTGAPLPAPPLISLPQHRVPMESTPLPQTKLQVEFRNSMLRIDAENATLRDALKAVSARTGAEIEFPAGELNERIFVHLGPGSAREVVSQLLNGARFNYIILSSASEPLGITRLILSRVDHAGESPTPETPPLRNSDLAATQVYGAGFSIDPSAEAEVMPPEKPVAIAPDGGNPVANRAQHQGSGLSGEDLDRMQKMQIQQEQQQFSLQLQQQRQQEEGASQNSPH
jgi:hypothetical protein